MSYGPAIENDPRLYTSDGVRIVDGGRYFNYYDGFWVTVHFGDSMTMSPTGEYWQGWYDTKKDDGSNGPSLNGERMVKNPPSWY